MCSKILIGGLLVLAFLVIAGVFLFNVIGESKEAGDP